jgi:SAM-dependent methyltransferase
VDDETRQVERLGFDRAVQSYERARPSYPPALFDDLFDYLGAESAIAEPLVVEVGAGTGKATVSLLERGARVTAVEIGAEMSEALRRNFPDKERLTVVHAPFEDTELESMTYDLVTSFTAFHWVRPDVRYAKAHMLLRPGGALGVAMTNQIASDADHGFFARVQPIYKTYFPEDDPPELQGEDVVPPEFSDMAASKLFEDIRLQRYRWDQTYPTPMYADLMRSYSGMQMMAPERREALISEICAVADAEYGGSVTRPIVITLVLGRRKKR